MLTDKTILITGGSSGLGRHVAAYFAPHNRVIVTGRDTARLSDAVSRLGVETLNVDVRDHQVMADAIASLGKIDIAIANAGISPSAKFIQTSPDMWEDVVATNLTGVYNCFRAALMTMDVTQSGRLIAVASTAGLKAYPYVAAYCAAKHGVIGLVKSLALELASTSVTVNAVCPGFMDTEMTQQNIDRVTAKTGRSADETRKLYAEQNPQKKLIPVADVAACIDWLCAPASASVNGQAIALSGGEV